jgi:hypothetical protein
MREGHIAERAPEFFFRPPGRSQTLAKVVRVVPLINVGTHPPENEFNRFNAPKRNECLGSNLLQVGVNLSWRKEKVFQDLGSFATAHFAEKRDGKGGGRSMAFANTMT